jgi:hypothetical protein
MTTNGLMAHSRWSGSVLRVVVGKLRVMEFEQSQEAARDLAPMEALRMLEQQTK